MDNQKYVQMQVSLKIPVTDEELYELCVRSNGEGELDQIGCGYDEISFTEDEVKEYLKRDYKVNTIFYERIGESQAGWICGEDLEEDWDKWFIEKKKEKYGRYDYDPIFDEESK